MIELKDYTDEELREELKRRSIERRKNTPREITYVEFEATIKEVDNIYNNGKNWYGKGLHKYRAFELWRYKLQDWTLDREHDTIERVEFKLKQGVFKRNESPQEGDRVKIRYRKTKSGYECFNIWNAKIVEIVKRNNDEQLSNS